MRSYASNSVFSGWPFRARMAGLGWGALDAMSVDRQERWLALVLALAPLMMSALALSGCTSSIADLPLVGTPADAPERPKEQAGYLPVNDLPPDRDDQVLDLKQRAKLQAELIAARDRQAVATPPQNGQTNSAQSTAQSQSPK
jgi:hypothetical protein